jgi:predicted ferric reductase
VEFGIKALGDFSATIGDVVPGETVYLDAPYGVFSIDNNKDAPGFGYIIGGIGVTPCMSMLRSMARRGDRRPLWLFYGNTAWDDVIYREEIEALARQLDLTVMHVLEHPPEDWTGEQGFIRKEILESHLPQDLRGQLHYFLCGPTPMTTAAESGLREIGVPLDHIQTEIFELV